MRGAARKGGPYRDIGLEEVVLGVVRWAEHAAGRDAESRARGMQVPRRGVGSQAREAVLALQSSVTAYHERQLRARGSGELTDAVREYGWPGMMRAYGRPGLTIDRWVLERAYLMLAGRLSWWNDFAALVREIRRGDVVGGRCGAGGAAGAVPAAE